MIKINLVPIDVLEKEAQRQQGLQAGVVGAAILFLVVAVSLGHVYHINRLEHTLADRKQELDKLQKIVAQVEELEHTAAAVKARLHVITDLLRGRPLYPYFMMDFSSTLPSDVWVTAITTAYKDGNILSLTTTASSMSSSGIAAWMRNIQKTPGFAEPTLGSVSTADQGGQRIHSFSITTSYTSPKL